MAQEVSKQRWDLGISSSLIALCTILAGILLRLCVGLHPYSGMGIPPQFGDYEAQRHWMEVTVNLPPTDWYKSTPANNLSYWGLDYPPLSGYQSWLCGKVLQAFDPASVALNTSKGYETAYSKLLMRWTSLFADIICYFPAAIACAYAFSTTKQDRSLLLLLLIFNPALVIIDHGHFQYNSISLGLAAGAMAAASARYYSLSSILFCLSLNHKQMSLYYAPAFFGIMLGVILKQPSMIRKASKLVVLGVAVVGTFAICWLPYLTSVDDALTVVRRIFPTQRGLFEDYVANFWCVSSIVYKWKRKVETDQLLRICTLSTLASFLPLVVLQTRHPSGKALVVGCLNSAFAFFMLSFQVHEKSIMLPLLPSILLAPNNKNMALTMMYMSMFSMYPLLRKDQVMVPYWCLIVLLYAASNLFSASRQQQPWTMDILLQGWKYLSALVALCIHVAAAVFEPPEKYPYLFDAAFVSFTFAHFVAVFITSFAWQYTEFSNRQLKNR